MKIRLMLITPDYPFGERAKYSFLQEEINALNESEFYGLFNEIIIINTSKSSNQITGFLPKKSRLITVSKTSTIIFSYVYAFFKLLSIETYEEWCTIKNLKYKPSFLRMVRKWIIFYSSYYKTTQSTKKLFNDGYVNITYSYWLLEDAYTISKWKKKGRKNIAISRCHGVEVRDYETYTPFRNIVDSYLDSINFVALGKQDEYNEILSRINNSITIRNQNIQRLGVKLPQVTNTSELYDKNQILIISVSYVTRVKRLDILIDALQLTDEKIKIKWVHFGNGKLFNEIKGYANEKLDLKTNIEYDFKGYIENDQLMDFYKSNNVDAIINCSDSEGVPVSLMEAMSYGIVPIARNVGGNSELVINDVTGILLPERIKPMDLKNAIIKIKEVKAESSSFAEIKKNAYNHVNQNYNAEHNYREFYRFIFELAKKTVDLK